ncbi:MAG: transposase [Candidatus Binatia bacterium]
MTNNADLDERQQKGIVIAATSRLVKKGAGWLVPSQSLPTKYTVVLNDEGGFCSCPDHAKTGRACKHQIAVQLVIKRELNADGDVEVTGGFRITYSQQSWTAYNAAQTGEKELFMKLFRDLCAGIVQPPQGRGRPRLPVADMVFAAGLKVYRGNSARRFMGDMKDAQAMGLVAKVPHFNSVLNYLDDEMITPALQEMIRLSALPLKAIETDFAVDSTGFSSTQLVGQWKGAKYGDKHLRMEHDWLKCHAMTGVKTNIVVAVEIGAANSGDAPRFRPLLDATTANFNVRRVLGDKAYSSYANMDFAAERGVEPFVMFRDNATTNSGSEAWDRMFHLLSFNRREFMKAYHKRSNVEATFSAIKRVFGDFVRSKNKTAQVNEILLKILCHNLRQIIFAMHELGIVPSFDGDPADA